MKIGIAEHITEHIIQFLYTFWHFALTLLASYIYIVRRTIVIVSGAGGDQPASSPTPEFRHALRYFSRWEQLIDSRGCL
jgi:hypothetical protein